MHAFEYTLVLLAAVLVSNLIAQAFPRFSTPLAQTALGFLIAVSPGLPFEAAHLDPELFLILFIAPMLFDEAKSSDKQALWSMKQPILSLAVGLVLATCLSVGFVFNLLTPTIPLAAAFAVAAALSPTDVIAVLSLRSSATIPPSKLELLKGEGMLNEAASIVSFQFALSAVLTASFSLASASVQFVYMFAGGLALGVGLILLRNLLVRLVTNSGVESSTFFVLFEIITPCLVFLVAELLHTSGIIAVVAAGIAYSIAPRGMSPTTARNAIVSSSVWAVIDFTLSGLCFLMLGTQLPGIVRSVAGRSDVELPYLFMIMACILLMIYAVRFAWALALRRHVDMTEAAAAEAAAAESQAAESVDKNTASPPPDAEPGGSGFSTWFANRSARRQARQEANQLAHEDPIYWKHHLLDALQLTIAGTKGAITLALVLSFPVLLEDGSLFPERDLILFLSSGIILISLILANLAMPLVCPKQEDEHLREEEIEAMVGIYRRVIRSLLDEGDPEDAELTDSLVGQYAERIQRLRSGSSLTDSEELELRARIVGWEYQNTLELVANGEVSGRLGFYYLNRLARQLARLEHHSTMRESVRAVYEQLSRRAARLREVREARRSNPAYGQVSTQLTLRGLSAANASYVIANLEKMQRDLGSGQDDLHISPGLVNRFLYTINRQLASYERRFRSRLRLLTDAAWQEADEERLELRLTLRALQWEREAILDALRSEEISRETAKEMMDSVAAMELDIEEFLE